MLGVGRDLCGSSSPTLLPKQGHLRQAARTLSRQVLNTSREEDFHNLSGQPVPVLCHPQSKDVLPRVQMELPVL